MALDYVDVSYSTFLFASLGYLQNVLCRTGNCWGANMGVYGTGISHNMKRRNRRNVVKFYNFGD